MTKVCDSKKKAVETELELKLKKMVQARGLAAMLRRETLFSIRGSRAPGGINMAEDRSRRSTSVVTLSKVPGVSRKGNVAVARQSEMGWGLQRMPRFEACSRRRPVRLVGGG